MARWMMFAAGTVLAALAPFAASAGALQVTVLDKEGKPVADAVVVLRPVAAGAPVKPLPDHVTINQEKMRFVPAVSLVAVGAKGTFTNNDPWEHHVRASPAGVLNFDAGSGFELRLDGKPEGKAAKSAEAVFDKAGPILLGCHLHASMRGHVYVSDSPWAALTNGEGIASFERVPEGNAQMRVWQADQLIDLPPEELKLTAAPAKASVQLTVVPKRRRI
ncbi:MAG TPA: plastocyanin [Ramlibacter sp.]|uniref:cupredoxin domain-containing protein n=1 Tax=Ramlibacter sp. TaxID=1917967 RepID=UPI002CC1129B|nr:plastocyanin [Ramlibacter sp.]HVZ46982.1 plastocyanin [Ramlibacter sp.]